ncbi:acyltransferase family protein [Mucilaginibacter sp. UR6-11]|uniref:acyltransferase family protein n=1 Tax=Mucilaginibacter sp. UR6-11 TaxID=1435644 RepID=UPI00351CF452|nr:acyltransferase [Mucilaginibacter sp. UR6-11]
MGVKIFFVISGFLITTLLLKEKIQTGNISLKLFYARRFLRILPVAFLYLLTLFVLNGYLHLNIQRLSFLSALCFFQNLPIKNVYNWYTSHFWSLSVEEQFYISFPFLLAFSSNKYFKVLLLLVVFIPVIMWLGYHNIGIFYSNRIVHLFTYGIINLFGSTLNILIGSLFSMLMFKGFFEIKKRWITNYLSLILLVIAILISSHRFLFFVPYLDIVLFPVLIGLVIILNLSTTNILVTILNSKLLVYLGLLSYSLYIWQQLFTNSQNLIIPSSSIPVQLLSLLIVANVSYYLYEKPFLKLKSHFIKKDLNAKRNHNN